jgi:putative acetyltransferase
MSETILIRAYDPADLEAIIAVFMSAVHRVAARDYKPAQLRAWAPAEIDRARWVERRLNRETWVAERDGAVVGFTDLEPDGHLDMMFVAADAQGLGVASRLEAEVEASARRQGLARIFTEASLTARPFFERRGYVILTAQEVSVRGETLTNFRMEKRLA